MPEIKLDKKDEQPVGIPKTEKSKSVFPAQSSTNNEFKSSLEALIGKGKP